MLRHDACRVGKDSSVWDGVASYQLDGGVTAHHGFDG